jgi:uncharacterized membrane protein
MRARPRRKQAGKETSMFVFWGEIVNQKKLKVNPIGYTTTPVRLFVAIVFYFIFLRKIEI